MLFISCLGFLFFFSVIRYSKFMAIENLSYILLAFSYVYLCILFNPFANRKIEAGILSELWARSFFPIFFRNVSSYTRRYFVSRGKFSSRIAGTFLRLFRACIDASIENNASIRSYTNVGCMIDGWRVGCERKKAETDRLLSDTFHWQDKKDHIRMILMHTVFTVFVMYRREYFLLATCNDCVSYGTIYLKSSYQFYYTFLSKLINRLMLIWSSN